MTEKKITYLKNYKVSNYFVENIFLTFDILNKFTIVENEAIFYRNEKSLKKEHLILDWENLELISIFLDWNKIEKSWYKIKNNKLTILNSPEKFTLKIITKNKPENNTKLMWLYKSNWLYCTQCESEGFRRITYYLDRPDVLTKFKVKITADKKKNPILLSNWNKIDFWDLEGNRHFAIWEDPFKKPCYLFALVAWNLSNIEDEFITMSGKKVKLQIFTESHNIDKTPFAMESLKKSMKWDEERFGREYDLDIFMIVAVDDFNSGAMENKWLNIFNSQACFATKKSATDENFKWVERVIAHEYFHNWTGNRITCRDWFQLSLKEGLTVYRDQEFTSDLHDRTVTRIQNVKALRSYQFKEDASPMAHSIRPSSFEEISNFYTFTVYEKGSEVIRIYESILGREGFRKGTDLYFDTFDGQAVTTEDFLWAMWKANNKDLSQMSKWYEQAGTPILDVISDYDEKEKTYTLFFRQTCPRTSETNWQKKPFLIPIKYWLIDKITKKEIKSWTYILDEFQNRLVFKNIKWEIIPSLLRDFSAPVKLKYAYEDEDLLFLSKYDTNEFNKYEAFSVYTKEIIINNYNSNNIWKYKIPEDFIKTYKYILNSSLLSNWFKAETLSFPSISEISEVIEKNINYTKISEIRDYLYEILSNKLEEDFLIIYKELNNIKYEEYSIEPEVVGSRKFKNLVLKHITIASHTNFIAYWQFNESTNMTDSMWALEAIILIDNEIRKKSLEEFYNKWKNDNNVIDKWFSIQVKSKFDNIFEKIEELIKNPLFDIKNPNKVRSIYSVFTNSNLDKFHSQDWKGYKLIADKVIELDKLNPMVASRLAKSLISWKNLCEINSKLMREQLERISLEKDLSPDLSEVVRKGLE